MYIPLLATHFTTFVYPFYHKFVHFQQYVKAIKDSINKILKELFFRIIYNNNSIISKEHRFGFRSDSLGCTVVYLRNGRGPSSDACGAPMLCNAPL